MKILMKSILLAAAFTAVGAFAADEAENATLMMDALKFKGADFAGAEEIFAKRQENVVLPLKKLSDADMVKVANLVDMNRIGIRTENKADEEYHYTLDSAADQALKEQSKPTTNAVRETKTAAIDDNPATCKTDFFVTATNTGLVFMFRNSNRSNGSYELYLEPLDVANANGVDTIHLRFDQDGRDGGNLNWSNFGSSKIGAVTTARTADRLGLMVRFELPWTSFYSLIGTIPLKNEQVQQWRIQAFRWTSAGGFSLSGLPGECTQSFVIVPGFIRRTEMGVKHAFIEDAIKAFYLINEKKGGTLVDLYLDDVMSQYRNTVGIGKSRYRLENARIAYPRSYSEYYWAAKPRKLPTTELDPEKKKETNFRIVEWKDYMKNLGDGVKKSGDNSAMVDMVLFYDYPKYATPQCEYWKMRMEAISDRVFSDKFLNKE